MSSNRKIHDKRSIYGLPYPTHTFPHLPFDDKKFVSQDLRSILISFESDTDLSFWEIPKEVTFTVYSAKFCGINKNSRTLIIISIILINGRWRCDAALFTLAVDGKVNSTQMAKESG